MCLGECDIVDAGSKSSCTKRRISSDDYIREYFDDEVEQKMTDGARPVEEQIEQAEELFLTLMGPDASWEDWDRYEHLVKTSAIFREIFSRCETILRDLGAIDTARLLDGNFTAKIETDTHLHAESATSLQTDNFTEGRRAPVVSGVLGWFEGRRLAWVTAAATVAVLLIGGLSLQDYISSSHEVLRYETQNREHRIVELPDGSSLSIGARTSINVQYTNAVRMIELRSGEVLATVAHDEGRPFILTTDDVLVMATGTAFNVRNGSQYSTVSVLEGAVSVVPQISPEMIAGPEADSSGPTQSTFESGTLLRNGQQLRAEKNTELGLIREVDIDRVVSWQSGQLYFIEDELYTVFEEVMRYSDVSFKVMDQNLGTRMYTGSFRPDSLEAWLDGMERAYSLRVTRLSGNWIVIAPAD